MGVGWAIHVCGRGCMVHSDWVVSPGDNGTIESAALALLLWPIYDRCACTLHQRDNHASFSDFHRDHRVHVLPASLLALRR